MEDSFKVRVDRAFGSLDAAAAAAAIKSTSSSLSSLWCLTDEEIERKQWIQDKITPHKDKDEEDVHRLKNPKPYSSFLQGLLADSAQPSTSHQDLESDIQDLDDEEDNNQQPQLSKPDDHSNEEWNIRSSVGMDCTLDNEEEEDVYDKVASGREERFYMRDVNDYEVEMDSNNELPNSLTDVIKDPRANHMAAKLRLKEDEESARKLGLQVSEEGTKSKKRVCFEEVIGQSGDVVMNEAPASVPDYVRNPSKYTHYTFDSMDDVDEESNRKAYMELFNSLRGSSGMETQHDFSPTSIIFTPKKKSGDGSMKKSKVDGFKKVVPISVGSEDSVMEEDEPEIASSKLQKGGRRYRTTTSDHVE